MEYCLSIGCNKYRHCDDEMYDLLESLICRACLRHFSSLSFRATRQILFEILDIVCLVKGAVEKVPA